MTDFGNPRSNYRQSHHIVYNQREIRTTDEGRTNFNPNQPPVAFEVHEPVDLIRQTINYPSGYSFQQLGTMQNVLLDLIDEFKTENRRIVIDGEKKDSYEKRLILVQKQLDGLMKQKIIFEAPDRQGGTRKLDYNIILTEKENQVIELSKKIDNLEERLRRNNQRETQLQNQIVFLYSKLKAKNDVIEAKERQLSQQIAYNKELNQILSQVRKIVNKNAQISLQVSRSVKSLESVEIREIVSSVHSMARREAQTENQILKLMRGLEKLAGKNSSMMELENVIEGWIIGLYGESFLRKKLLEGEEGLKNGEKLKIMEEKMMVASQLYEKQLENLQKRHPELSIRKEQGILSTLLQPSTTIRSVVNGFAQVQKTTLKTVQIPVQDARTKQLIFQLATQMKKIYTKYPKLYRQIDPRLAEFFSQEIIDIIDVDEVDKLVSIVKYEPQIVRVENVYAYSSERSRKVQFHLRVLLKALLTEMEKITIKTGFVPEIDEGMIGLIKEEIIEVVDIDDILKVYRPVPKIVQVQKVIEKIVEKVVEVPKIVAAQSRVEVPVEVKKVEVVENVRNVPVSVPTIQKVYIEKPVEVPKIIEKIVEVPIHHQVPVEVVREVEKVVTVEKEVDRIVEVQKIEFVDKQVLVEVPTIKQVILEVEKLVEVEKVVEVIKPIEIVVEKYIQIVKEIPKVVEVERIKEIVVEKPVYFPAPEIQPHVIVKEVPVEKIVQKIVTIPQVEERIIEVSVIKDKIVQVRDVQKVIQTVDVIVQKPVFRDRIKQVTVQVEKPIIQVKEVEKVVDRFISVPVKHEIIKVQKEYIKQPVYETVQSVVYKEIQIEKPVIVEVDHIVEVEKVINHFIDRPQIVNIFEQKLIPVETVVEKPISVPTIIEKVIEKIVQVPKVVQVEKVVQKIVPVPRVVEKVVEVEKIVEKIVNKVITKEIIEEVQKIVHVPVFEKEIYEVEVPKNVFVETKVPVNVTHEVLVKDQKIVEKKTVQNIEQPPKIIVQTQEVARQMMVQKIVPLFVPQSSQIEIKKQIIVPVEIQIPVDFQKNEIVPVENIRKEIVYVDRVRQLPIPVAQTNRQVIEVQRIVEKPYIQEKQVIVPKQIPYFEKEFVEVKVVEEKIVPVVTEVVKLERVAQLCDRVVDRVVQIPKIYAVEQKIEKAVQKPVIVQVEKIVPHIINVNKYVEKIVEKIIQIPLLINQLQQVQSKVEVPVPFHTTKTQIKEVEKEVQVAVIEEKLKTAVDKIHVIDEILQIADKNITKQMPPVILTQDKVMEVPFIVEKIVEKIVVMPQIVEVLKYIHEIDVQSDLGVKVSSDIGEKQIEYKRLAANVRTETGKLLSELRIMAQTHTHLRHQVELISRFLAQFQKFVVYPKIHEILRQVQVEKEVEKKKIVSVPVGSSQESFRMELSKAILIEKLILELKRIKEENPSIRFELDEDIKLIFGAELGTKSKILGEGFNSMILDYSNSIQNKFRSMGGWTRDHQFMLNSFLEERFLMANILRSANSQLNKTKAISEKRLDSMRRYKYERDQMQKSYGLLMQFLPTILEKSKTTRTVDEEILRKSQEWVANFYGGLINPIAKREPTRQLGNLNEERFNSTLREKEKEIMMLKERIRQLMERNVDHRQSDYRIQILEKRIWEYENQKRSGRDNDFRVKELEKTISYLQSENRSLKIEIQRIKNSSNEKYEIQIRRLLQEIEILKIQIQKRQRESSEKKSSSSYGVNFGEYANLGSSQGTVQLEGNEKVYQSKYTFGSTEQDKRVSMSQSRQEFGNLPSASYRHEYQSPGKESTLKSHSYIREGGSERESYLSSDVGKEGSAVEMYRASEVIKKTSHKREEGRKY